MPFIPDILKEESHSAALSIKNILIEVAAFGANELLKLPNGSRHTLYITFTVVNIVIGVFAVCYTKNIIGSKDHVAREITSQYSHKKPLMVKEAFK